MKQDEFSIIVDTREQIPWEFGFHTTSRRKLDTGDYAIEGMEDLLCIERKQSVSEIANNITEKRFPAFLERMGAFHHKFILCEFSLDDVYNFPRGSDIPERLWPKLKITNNYILRCLIEMALNHDIHICYCGDSEAAERLCVQIMRRIYRKYKDNENIL